MASKFHSTTTLQLDEAKGASEDARSAAEEAKQREGMARRQGAAEVAALEAEIGALRGNEQARCDRAGEVEALQV